MQTFNSNLMKLSVVKPGTKAASSNKAEVTTASTVNKFSLNPLASRKLGVETGEKVTLLVNDEATGMNDLLFIAKGIDEKNQATLASVNGAEGVGRVLHFNYAGIWSRILQFEVNALELNPTGMVDEGLLSKYTTKAGNTAYVANYRVSFELGEAMEIDYNGEEVTIYPLINASKEEYKSNVVADEVTDVDYEAEA